MFSSLGATSDAVAGEYILKVMSYNIAGLPYKKPNGGRFTKMGKILKTRRDSSSAPDIVFIQEAFMSKTKRVQKQSKFTSRKNGPKRGFLDVFSSGLIGLTDLQITNSNLQTYKNCHSWDCQATKGILHIRVKIPGLDIPLDLITTHMQANAGSNEQKVSAARALQVKTLANFVNDNVGERPYILAGDLNLKPNDSKKPSYDILVKDLEITNAGEVCIANPITCEIDTKTPVDELWTSTNDQHFYKQSPELSITPIYAIRNMTERSEDKTLSDHKGFEVHYLIKW